MKKKSRRVAAPLLLAGLLAGSLLTSIEGRFERAAFAGVLLNEQGSLAASEQGSFDQTVNTYSFEGESGQTLTIELKSDDFDPYVFLRGPLRGEEDVVLTGNDNRGDFDIDSTIVIELPETGTYTVGVSTHSNEGGNYQLEVRPANEYEQAFDKARELAVSGDYTGSVAAYTAAIALDDTDPAAYINRARVRTGPPEAVLDANVADWERAAELLEQQGHSEFAVQVRELAHNTIIRNASCTDFAQEATPTNLIDELARLEIDQALLGVTYNQEHPEIIALSERQSELQTCLAQLQSQPDESLVMAATVDALESEVARLTAEATKSRFVFTEDHPGRQYLAAAIEALQQSLSDLSR